jgi:ATP-binding cassette subfamily B protein
MTSGRPGPPSAQEALPTWRRLLFFLGERPWLVVLLLLVSFCSGVLESAVLALIAEIAATLVAGTRSAAVHFGPIYLHLWIERLLLLAFAFAAARVLLQTVLAYLPARISADVQASLRNRLFAAFAQASWSVQSRDGEGHLQELMTTQVLQATQGVMQAMAVVTAGLTLLALVASALVIGVLIAVVVMGAGLALFALLRPLNKLGSRHAKELSSAQLAYAAGVSDAVALAEEGQVFGIAPAQERHVAHLIDEARNRFFRTQLLGRLVPSTYQGIVFLLLVAGLGILYATSAGQLASLGAVVLLLVRASSYGQQLQGAYHLLYQFLPFLDRLRDAETRYVASAVPTGDRNLSSVPSLALTQVSYAYDSRNPVLHDLTFGIEPGEVIGVVGPSGAGKSTLVQILLGLRSPSEGAYLVEGAPMTTLSLTSRTQAFAYVPQDPRLLRGTVADNIRFLRPIADDAVERAARLARIHDEIMSWPLGYQTPIGQRADAVSGGQGQRLCLARALAGDPLVLVLDEPTSALDPSSESLVQESLLSLRGRLTLIVVSHRMSTLTICDRILVLVDGYLQAFAPAPDLLASEGFYQHAAQLSLATPGPGPAPFDRP